MKTDKNAGRKLMLNLIFVLALLVCFGIATYGFVMIDAVVENNSFQTGTIEINMSGTNVNGSIIDDSEYLFEPGMTVVKNFYVENTGSGDAYYKVYFDNVSGDLASVLAVTIKNEDVVLAEGTLNELTAENVTCTDDALKARERRELTVTFYYPNDAKNDTASKEVYFDMCALSVQTLNNPDKKFE